MNNMENIQQLSRHKSDKLYTDVICPFLLQEQIRLNKKFTLITDTTRVFNGQLRFQVDYLEENKPINYDLINRQHFTHGATRISYLLDTLTNEIKILKGCVKSIRQNEIDEIFSYTNEDGQIGYTSYPRTMEMSIEDVELHINKW